MWNRRNDDDLSDAVVVCLQTYPGSNLADFTARFPEPDTQARVRALLDEAIRVPEPATPLSLQQIGAQVRTVMHERHPELSEESLRKLGNYVTYLMRCPGKTTLSRRSGTSIRGEHPSRGGNKPLKRAFFLAAFASLHDPASRAYYDPKRAAGKKHNAALICLARRRMDVLHATLHNGTLY